MIHESTKMNLRPWSDTDFPLMERMLGDPAMTVHIGGPESLQQLRERHQRYTEFSQTGPGCMYVVLVGPKNISAGSVGYWEKIGRAASSGNAAGASSPNFKDKDWRH
jgi:RimJ/RimL family protein N-acetyltransferase